jgi:GDPmannose 4,6-dehydratase
MFFLLLQKCVAVDSNYFRPTEVEMLIGDPSKAKSKLGWVPKYDLNTLVKEMMECGLAIFEKSGVAHLEYAVE